MTVAPCPFGSTHDDEIVSLAFDERLFNLHFHVDFSGHAGGHFILDPFPGLAKRHLYLKPQDFIQICIGVCVHSQDWLYIPFEKELDEKMQKVESSLGKLENKLKGREEFLKQVNQRS